MSAPELPDWVSPMIYDPRGDILNRLVHPAFYKPPELPPEITEKINHARARQLGANDE